MGKRVIIFSCLVFFTVCLFSCRALQFYGETDKPFFYPTQKNVPVTTPSDSLNVITFNIKKSIKIQLAIQELQQFEKTRPVDIFLLQEMDERGVAAIADSLHLNYLYIPIAYDRSDKKNIGNAILTRGAIAYPKKLILPHAKWQNQQRRHVTIGEVNIHQKKILVFCVHTETFAMSRADRMDQIDSIVAQAKTALNYKYVLIGGDFNTVFSKDAHWVVQKFTGSGFDWPTAKVGYTAKGMLGLVKPTNDYLFSKGFSLQNAFTIYSSRSSDHFPVFATLKY